MSKKTGRNEKCPCGSGKKYKHCCLDKDVAARRTSASIAAPAPLAFAIHPDDDDIDDLSNRVLNLIEAGKLESAEIACRELRERYPDMIDGLERTAQLREAQGRFAEAAESFHAAADFASTHAGFDKEGIAWYRHQVARLAAQ